MHKAQLLSLNQPGVPRLLWARTTLAPPDQRKAEGNTECMEEKERTQGQPESGFLAADCRWRRCASHTHACMHARTHTHTHPSQRSVKPRGIPLGSSSLSMRQRRSGACSCGTFSRAASSQSQMQKSPTPSSNAGARCAKDHRDSRRLHLAERSAALGSHSRSQFWSGPSRSSPGRPEGQHSGGARFPTLWSWRQRLSPDLMGALNGRALNCTGPGSEHAGLSAPRSLQPHLGSLCREQPCPMFSWLPLSR